MRPKPYFAPPFAPARRPGDARVTTLALPGFRQVRNYTCGYACSLMVLRFFDPDAPGRALYEALGTDRTGTRQTAIVQALRAQGVSVNVRYDMDFGRVRAAIDTGKPMIGYLADIEHWVALYGYGVSPQRIFIADPRADTACEHRWDSAAGRLAGFAMVCSDRTQRRALALPARQPAAASSPDRREPQLAFDFQR